MTHKGGRRGRLALERAALDLKSLPHGALFRPLYALPSRLIETGPELTCSQGGDSEENRRQTCILIEMVDGY
jgi:hypothetical protein